MKQNKTYLYSKVKEQCPFLTNRQVSTVVTSVFDVIENALKNGDEIAINGFGTFRKYFRKPSEGYNPMTHEKVKVPGFYIIRFNPSDVLKKAVQNNTNEQE